MGLGGGAAHDVPLVLVADHVAGRREAYVSSLVTEGYRVEQASTAAEALEKARRLDPTVVVVDLSLPADGCEITQALKSTPDVGDLCVVALVSPNESSKKQQAEHLGADVCVLKPCSPTTLLEYVRTCVAGYRRR
jgi:two-component system KDP operon response regulator KdpE